MVRYCKGRNRLSGEATTFASFDHRLFHTLRNLEDPLFDALNIAALCVYFETPAVSPPRPGARTGKRRPLGKARRVNSNRLLEAQGTDEAWGDPC